MREKKKNKQRLLIYEVYSSNHGPEINSDTNLKAWRGKQTLYWLARIKQAVSSIPHCNGLIASEMDINAMAVKDAFHEEGQVKITGLQPADAVKKHAEYFKNDLTTNVSVVTD